MVEELVGTNRQEDVPCRCGACEELHDPRLQTTSSLHNIDKDERPLSHDDRYHNRHSASQ
mgnify:CR=1 FL=1